MRRALDALYDGCAWLAAVFMIGVLVMVLLSVLGRQLNFHVPGTASRPKTAPAMAITITSSGASENAV